MRCPSYVCLLFYFNLLNYKHKPLGRNNAEKRWWRLIIEGVRANLVKSQNLFITSLLFPNPHPMGEAAMGWGVSWDKEQLLGVVIEFLLG